MTNETKEQPPKIPAVDLMLSEAQPVMDVLRDAWQRDRANPDKALAFLHGLRLNAGLHGEIEERAERIAQNERRRSDEATMLAVLDELRTTIGRAVTAPPMQDTALPPLAAFMVTVEDYGSDPDAVRRVMEMVSGSLSAPRFDTNHGELAMATFSELLRQGATVALVGGIVRPVSGDVLREGEEDDRDEDSLGLGEGDDAPGTVEELGAAVRPSEVAEAPQDDTLPVGDDDAAPVASGEAPAADDDPTAREE